MKKVIFLCLSLVTVSELALAQNYSYIDSLMRELRVSEGVDRAELYLNIAWEYRKSHPDSTIYYSEKALELTEQLGSKYKAQALNYKGVAYHYMGNSLKSFEYYNQAIDQALKTKDSIQYAHALNSLGRLYLTQGDFVNAYNNYFAALEVFRKKQDVQGLGYSYKSLAELYQTQGNYKKALEMSQRTLDIRLETGNVHGQISILLEIALIHKALGNFDKSFDFYLQSKIKAESINDKINIAIINRGIAELYYDEELMDEALIFAEKAYSAAANTQNLNLLGGILLQLGKVHYKQNNLKTSLDYLNQAVEVAQKSQEMAILRDGHYFLAKIYEQQSNYSLAYEHYQQYAEIEKRLSSADVARTIERFESRIEIDQKDQQNELLIANQAKDQAIIGRQRVQNIALLIVALVLLALGVNIYITSRRRKRANVRLYEKNIRIAQQREEITAQNEQISKQNEKLKKRNDQLAEINNEKNTLMNIVAHDLKSPFNRIKGLIELLRLSRPNDEQKNYINLLDDIAQNGTDLIRDLLDVNSFEEDSRKPIITKIDIHNILLEKTKLFYAEGKSKGIEIRTPSVESHLFFRSDKIYLSRILDNLISNAIKFSYNDSVVILNAGATQDHAFVSIKDQGPGFSEEDKEHLFVKFRKLSARPTAGESSNGLGLAIVKTLVDRLDGEIELISRPGKGSEFIIKFPVKAEVASTT
ncbi:tetratricopeptide repeat protein [Fulvivirga sp. RKSG066]|uniref:ATP-binding protein n=1 Tax=Fulvivirga aurantia TaxID=2529383 RepID=UPI0012BC8269|nr:tetratricopeptide repeat protein [Fulvivirga aurantia]MTI21111.1 tetratricopeptide repeat protein [Fulvivirga aurantia]